MKFPEPQSLADFMENQGRFSVEPLIINQTIDNKTWVHPYIKKIINENNLDTFDGSDVYFGQLVRFVIEDNGNTLSVVAVMPNEKSYNETISIFARETEDKEDVAKYILDSLQTALFEDCWGPKEQFYFSEYGYTVNENFGYDSKLVSLTFDAGLYKEGRTWKVDIK